LPAAGVEQVNTPPSPANVVAASIDLGDAAAAERVQDFLSTTGFDVSPGIVPASNIDAQGDVPAILFARGSEQEAEVVQQYLPGVPAREADLPRGWHVAIVAAPGFHPERVVQDAEPTC
jgi:hypothetical protein